jgi:salicylate hydroxylase
MAVKRRKILVSGGGIAGLTAALCLAKYNNNIEVHERAQRFDKLGAGIQISPNAFHVLKWLDLGKEIRLAADEPNSILMMNASTGEMLAELPLGFDFENKYEAPYLVLHRSTLHDILLKACHEHPDIDIRMGSEIIDAASHPNGVTALIRTDKKQQERVVDVLVAADGIHSQLRVDALDLPKAQYSGKIAWRTLIPAQAVEDNRLLNNTVARLGPGAHVVSYPVEKKQFLNIIAVTQEKNADETQGRTVSNLSSHFTHWHEDIKTLIANSDDWTAWPLYEMALPTRLAENKVAMIGDAAHAMLPFAAQGAAQAVEDAFVLAHCLNEHNDTENALNVFQQARLPRVREVMKTARTNGRIYHMSGIMAFARNLILKKTSGKKLLQKQDWIYRWKPKH